VRGEVASDADQSGDARGDNLDKSFDNQEAERSLEYEEHEDDWWHVGTTRAYSRNGFLVIRSPPVWESPDDAVGLFLFLSRTDDVLPTSIGRSWKRVAECYKSDNKQRRCFTVDDCKDFVVDYNGFEYCRRFGSWRRGYGRGKDLATVVFYKDVSDGDSRDDYDNEYIFEMPGSKPSWAIMTAIAGIDNSKRLPIRDAATESCDGYSHSEFPSVTGKSGDVLLLHMANDDRVSISRFRPPFATRVLGDVIGKDETGVLYAGNFWKGGRTGKVRTRGRGGKKCKDGLISLAVQMK